MSGLRNCGQTPMVKGTGKSQYAASQGRPVWISGNRPAHMTANSVMASAKRLMELRQDCFSKNKMAEMSVPAWPLPIHPTKLMMANPQPTRMLTAQMPEPFMESHAKAHHI